MKKEKKIYRKKSKGQTMVEFALALPILMLIILGLMEAGRLLFIYGSVTTASRQAVRYGSATGYAQAGTLKYLDCGGIEAAAKDMGILLPIAEVDIIYTRGGVTFADCDTSDGTYPFPSASYIANGDRIEVTSTSHYAPMIPWGSFGTFDITTGSKRTIYIGIKINSTALPSSSPIASVTLSKIPSQLTYSSVGEDITYIFKVENTGEVDFIDYKITDVMLNASNPICSGGALVQGDVQTCTRTYTTTSDDVIGGDIVNNATVSASDGTNTISHTTGATVTFIPAPQLTLAITASPASSSTLGATITYTYLLQNMGTVDLISPYNITDDTALNTSCTGATSPLAPGQTTTCSGTYNLSQSDLDAGVVINHATAQGVYAGNTVTSNEASATIITKPLVFTITSELQNHPYYDEVGTTVFSYHLQNIGLDDLSNFSVIDDNFPNGGITCPSVTLSPGAKTICVSPSYPITQDHVDTGLITRGITAFAENGTVSSLTKTEIMLAIQNPALTLTKTIQSPTSPTIPAEGDVVTYAYTLTNSGNVTLTSPYLITDDLITNPNNFDCSNATSSLPPAATTLCTGTYSITVEDELTGSVTNTATATAKIKVTTREDNLVSVTSSPDSATIYTYDGDRMTLSIISSSGLVPVSLDDNILFTYIIQNTGSTTLHPNSALLDYPLSNGLTNHNFSICSQVSGSFEPGEVIKLCTVPYAVVLGDVANGDTLINTATTNAENALGTMVSTTTALTLDVVPIPDCTEDQWTSSAGYENPDKVYYCSGGNTSCAEWVANQNGIESGHIPGTLANPPYWVQTNRCILQNSCQVSLTNIPMSTSASYSQSLTIENNSGVSVEISNIALSWETKNLEEVLLGGSQIYLGASTSNGGFSLPSPRWTIGSGNSIINLAFSNKVDWARAYITFSDNLCTGTILDSGN